MCTQCMLALSSHHIQNVVGDEALEIVATMLTDVGGAEVQLILDVAFESNSVPLDQWVVACLARVTFPETRTDECSTFSH